MRGGLDDVLAVSRRGQGREGRVEEGVGWREGSGKRRREGSGKRRREGSGKRRREGSGKRRREGSGKRRREGSGKRRREGSGEEEGGEWEEAPLSSPPHSLSPPPPPPPPLPSSPPPSLLLSPLPSLLEWVRRRKRRDQGEMEKYQTFLLPFGECFCSSSREFDLFVRLLRVGCSKTSTKVGGRSRLLADCGSVNSIFSLTVVGALSGHPRVFQEVVGTKHCGTH